MKLSSRNQLLKEADEVLRQIREEQKSINNRGQLNEGVLYNIWKKFVDISSPVGGVLALGSILPAIVKTPTAQVGPPVSHPLALVTLGAVGISVLGAQALHKVLANYFQSKYFDEKYKPFIDELVSRISSNEKVKKAISKLTYLKNKYEKLQSKEITRDSFDSADAYDAMMDCEKELDRLFNSVLNDPELMRKFTDALPSDKRSFAGEAGLKGYKDMIKKEILSKIEPTTDELAAIVADVKKDAEKKYKKDAEWLSKEKQRQQALRDDPNQIYRVQVDDFY